MSDTSTTLGEVQAQRLETALAEIEALVSRPDVAARLKSSPGQEDWNALQILGHIIEMMPYWMHHCRNIIQAQGEPPAFGRTLDARERLEGVEHGANSGVEVLMRELRTEVAATAAMIRGLSDADREKTGVHNRRGLITVNDAIEAFVLIHCEDHVQQIKASLGV